MSGGQQSAAFVYRRSFDAVLKGLDLQGPLGAELRAVGFDPEVGSRWPLPVFYAVAEVARRHRFPGLPPAEGLARLGEAWVEGFGETDVGAVVLGALRMLGPERAVPRFFQYAQTVWGGFAVDAQACGERCFRLNFREDVWERPEFVLGAVRGLMALRGAVPPPEVELGARAARRFELLVRW